MNANQSRGGTDFASTADKSFSHKPLTQDIDCTRFVEIDAISDDKTTTPVCHLVELPFRERPKYEALSYAWADDGVRREIEVDGATFKVGQNLFDALCFLRQRQYCGLYWIDALCINQKDITERNRQVRMMGQIYFRANAVIVWLGAKYAKYDKKSPRFSPLEPESKMQIQGMRKTRRTSVTNPALKQPVTPKPSRKPLNEGTIGSASVSAEEQEMVDKLCKDEYWTRLWIIQEIGQAESLKVCYGSIEQEWNAFIGLITKYRNGDSRPESFHAFRQQGKADGYPLRKLLEDNRNAICENRKDKIYGLVGLAGDVFDFPVDYRKSLFQIWTDTMEFCNKHDPVSNSGMISFGKLVKVLLMGDKCDPWAEMAAPGVAPEGEQERSHEALVIEDSTAAEAREVFTIAGNVAGVIKHLGPSTCEIVANLSADKEWGAMAQRLYEKHLGNARREGETLVRAILKSSKSELSNLCHNCVSSVVWTYVHSPSDFVPTWPTGIRPITEQVDPAVSAETLRTPRLYQLASVEEKLYEDDNRDDKPWKMGIVASHAQQDDLLCTIEGLEKAVFVRCSTVRRRTTMRLYGTAKMTRDMIPEHKAREHVENMGRRRYRHAAPPLKIKVDARTIWALLA